MAFEPINTQEEFDTAIKARLERERSTVSKQFEEKIAGLNTSIETLTSERAAFEKSANENAEKITSLTSQLEEANKKAAIPTSSYTEPTYTEDSQLPSTADYYSAYNDEPASDTSDYSYGSTSSFSDDFSQDYTANSGNFSLASDESVTDTGSSASQDTVPANSYDDLGVEKGFKTFTQLMDEDRKERDLQQKQYVEDDDDDSLPNLSWINDI